MRQSSSKDPGKEKILFRLLVRAKKTYPSKVPLPPSFSEHGEQWQHLACCSILLLVCHQVLASRRGKIYLHVTFLLIHYTSTTLSWHLPCIQLPMDSFFCAKQMQCCRTCIYSTFHCNNEFDSPEISCYLD